MQNSTALGQTESKLPEITNFDKSAWPTPPNGTREKPQAGWEPVFRDLKAPNAEDRRDALSSRACRSQFETPAG